MRLTDHNDDDVAVQSSLKICMIQAMESGFFLVICWLLYMFSVSARESAYRVMKEANMIIRMCLMNTRGRQGSSNVTSFHFI